jgi:triosephosphate isomerase (TIM)
MRKKIIAANWKMNMTLAEAESFYSTFILELPHHNYVETIIAPPFTALSKLAELNNRSQKIKLAAQNMYFEMSGAYTGEISPTLLKEFFIRYVILGHSERRTIFGETDALISRKVHAALVAQLRPILCIGETLEQRDAGKEKEVLTQQLHGDLQGVDASKFENIVIAYEPIWAIGTGRNATPQQAQETHAFIRSVLTELSNKEIAEKIQIQYGGSVKPSNAQSLLSQPDIDGALVGGASLDPRNFAEIVKIGNQFS